MVQYINSLLAVWSCVVFKVTLGLFIFILNGSLNAAEQESDSPNRAGTVGPLLQAEIDRIEQQKMTEQEKRSPQKEMPAFVARRAGTLPEPCHRPDNHPHEGHSHQGLPNPYSAKKH